MKNYYDNNGSILSKGNRRQKYLYRWGYWRGLRKVINKIVI